MIRNPLFAFLLLFSIPACLLAPPAFPAEKAWYRDAGDYLTQRSIRMGVPTQPGFLLLTDGKRFDATLGKRVSLFTWGEEGLATAWTAGIDAGMLASLLRYDQAGRLTFATNTFDGFFGAFLAKGWDGWLLMARFAHLSAHLVDNSPRILTPIGYSQFWEELLVGKTYPAPETASDWEIHAQGSLGFNHKSSPGKDNPRFALGLSFGHALAGPNSLALLASADMEKAGVVRQDPSYTYFLGLGSLNRPGSTLRPFRFGLAHHTGSDYRNQLYFEKHRWTTFEVAAEL